MDITNNVSMNNNIDNNDNNNNNDNNDNDDDDDEKVCINIICATTFEELSKHTHNDEPAHIVLYALYYYCFHVID